MRDGRMEPFESGSISRPQRNDPVPLDGDKAANYIDNFSFIPNEREDILRSVEGQLARGSGKRRGA